MAFFSKTSSLRKSTILLCQTYHAFQKRRNKLSTTAVHQLTEALKELQQKILGKDKKGAHAAAIQVERLSKLHLHKSSFVQLRNLISALAFALVVAVLVRQLWFELYEIPSGSMRPTLKEQDRLVVSKTSFGINMPLTTRHLHFEPHLVQRGGIFIFTGEDMDIRDVDTLYFYLFPGKKQYIKRLMGKPGDTLFFYGGKLYGIDSQDQDISDQFQIPQLQKIEHTPFLHFEGKVTTPRAPVQGVYAPAILHQMNEPLARLFLNNLNQPRGEMLLPGSKDIGELWGIQNFAMCRLLTKDQVRQFTDHAVVGLKEAPLYLELRHHPTLRHLTLGYDEYGRLRPLLGISSSLLPIDEEHLHLLFQNLYTARFVVKNGYAMRYGYTPRNPESLSFLPKLPGVPDGCYEFYYGKAYQVKWQGIVEELPRSHPLYQFDPLRVQLLYNLGIDFDLRLAPTTKGQRLLPARYAYFREGDLYLLGAPIFKKSAPQLTHFLEQEHNKKDANPLYQPFEDLGPPLKPDGSIDKDFIHQHGLTIPPKMYLALGDNHAMSADSRDFGFVPEGNLRGAPAWIFWPPGERWGHPNQPAYPFMNLSRAIVWLAATVFLGAWIYAHRKRNKLPLKI